MIRLLADEDFNGDLLRAFVRRVPEADIERVQDAELEGRPDPEVLRWAAEHGRIVLSHDKRTMPGHAYDRVARGEPMPGVILITQTAPIGPAVDALELIHGASDPSEWADRVVMLRL